MLDTNGLICEYDGRMINPKKANLSGKTKADVEAEAQKLREQIYERHKDQQQ